MSTPYPTCKLPANTECTTFLTRGQSMGLMVAVESGFVSAIAVVFLFCLILRNILRARRNFSYTKRRFFRSPLDVYMLSLLSSDLVQGMGKILDIKWLHEGVVRCGTYCTIQGVVQQMGETTVAQVTLAIAVHTFVIIVFRKGYQAIRVAFLVVCFIWLYAILFVAISLEVHRNKAEYTPTPYWCWMGHNFPGERLTGEYIWLWSSALISFVLYVPLFFCLRGNIEWHPEKWWRIHFQSTRQAEHRKQELAGILAKISQDCESKAQQVASVILLYPASYVILVLPISICRYIGIEELPSAASFFGTSLLGLSGLVNATLLLFTRPRLLLLDESTRHAAPRPTLSSSISTVQDGVTRLWTFTPASNYRTDGVLDISRDSRGLI